MKTKRKKKYEHLKRVCLMLGVLFFVMMIKTVDVKAAYYGNTNANHVAKVGKLTFKIEEDGIYMKKGSSKTKVFSSKYVSYFITNGTDLYCTQTIYSTDGYDLLATRIYYINIKKSESSLLFSTDKYVSLVDKYDKKLYVELEDEGGDNVYFGYYNLTTKKFKKIKKNKNVNKKYKGKLYLYEVNDDSYSKPIYRVDIKTGKAEKILKKACNVSFSGNTIYYTTINRKTGRQTLYKCNLKGKNIKKLGKVVGGKGDRIYYKNSKGKKKITPKLK